MAITEVCKTRAEVVGNWSPLVRRYRIKFVATSDDQDDGPMTVLAATSQGVPELYTSHYEYNNDDDPTAICIGISSPRRDAGDQHYFRWIFYADYEYNAEFDSDLGFVLIEPFYRQENVPVEWAWFKGFYENSFGPGTPLEQVAKNNPLPGFAEGNPIPISNSAGVPVLPPPDKREATNAYRVSWLAKYAFDWSGYINTVNLNNYTLFGYDQPLTIHEPDLRQITFNKTFDPLTLFLADVQAPQERIYNRYWYRYTVEFWEGDWCHYELDRGLAELSQPGDRDGRGGTMNSPNFVAGVPQLRAIEMPGGGGPINEPVLLNGEGKILVPQDPNNAVYLGYEKYRSVSFPNIPPTN